MNSSGLTAGRNGSGLAQSLLAAWLIADWCNQTDLRLDKEDAAALIVGAEIAGRYAF